MPPGLLEAAWLSSQPYAAPRCTSGFVPASWTTASLYFRSHNLGSAKIAHSVRLGEARTPRTLTAVGDQAADRRASPPAHGTARRSRCAVFRQVGYARSRAAT